MSVPTIVITSGKHAEGESEYVWDLGLNATQLVAVDFTKLQLQVVPTLVLVNNTGEVKYAKEGIPSLPDQDVLIRAAAPSPMNR